MGLHEQAWKRKYGRVVIREEGNEEELQLLTFEMTSYMFGPGAHINELRECPIAKQNLNSKYVVHHFGQWHIQLAYLSTVHSLYLLHSSSERQVEETVKAESIRVAVASLTHVARQTINHCSGLCATATKAEPELDCLPCLLLVLLGKVSCQLPYSSSLCQHTTTMQPALSIIKATVSRCQR